jgi:hypothetical protein
MPSSFMDRLFGFAAHLLFERPGRTLDYAAHITDLRESGDTLVTRFRTARDDQHNRTLLRHIIGIEHWAQARLRELLGAAPFREEYDKYQPSAQLTVSELAQVLQQTRQQSCAITQQLADAHVDLQQRVTHNQFGPLSVSGWLVYIRSHGMLESKKLHK